jgi:hypothetical protein
MLESFRQLKLDQDARVAALRELQEVHQERRDLTIDPRYQSLLDQIELFVQAEAVDPDLLNQCLENTRRLANEYREKANQLILERDSYAETF